MIGLAQSSALAYRTVAREWSPIERRLFEYSALHQEALADPLVERFLCRPENAATLLRALVTRAGTAAAMLDDRFATHLYEAQFVSYVRKRLRLTARRLVLRRATLARREFPMPAWPVDTVRLSGRSPETEACPGGNVPQAAQDEAAVQALRALPARQRLVLEAIVVRDQTEQQVARELGVSQQAVSKMKRRAIRNLRAVLDPARRGEQRWKNC